MFTELEILCWQSVYGRKESILNISKLHLITKRLKWLGKQSLHLLNTKMGRNTRSVLGTWILIPKECRLEGSSCKQPSWWLPICAYSECTNSCSCLCKGRPTDSDSCGQIRAVAFFLMPNSKKNWAPFCLRSFFLETTGSKQEAPGGGNVPTRTTPAPQHLPSPGVPAPDHAPGACVCGRYTIIWVFCWSLHSSGSRLVLACLPY